MDKPKIALEWMPGDRVRTTDHNTHLVGTVIEVHEHSGTVFVEWYVGEGTCPVAHYRLAYAEEREVALRIFVDEAEPHA